ncbi:MAG: L-rhamnose/proton symporter RhaT [Candidatus Acidiferrales bacterium]
MATHLLSGFLLVFAAGLLQGTFILPMSMVKQWSWEHTWATFSLIGMFVFNWIIAFLLVPKIFVVYAASPPRDIALLALFGLGWGVGAVLFGLGMDKLGMALGYPIIMGLIASLGALIPLLVFFPLTLLTSKGIFLLAGTVLVVFGIVLSSVGGSRRATSGDKSSSARTGAFAAGLIIAVMSGILSCLPNVGVAFGKSVISAAGRMGIPEVAAGNTIWALLFTFGFVVNFAYCIYRMVRRRTLGQYWNRETPRNLGLSAMMALMWIGSFYLYGAGAGRLGRWGVVAGWPLFITISIVVGYLWGVWTGEWKDAPQPARRLLNQGLLVLIVAVIIVGLSNFF